MAECLLKDKIMPSLLTGKAMYLLKSGKPWLSVKSRDLYEVGTEINRQCVLMHWVYGHDQWSECHCNVIFVDYRDSLGSTRGHSANLPVPVAYTDIVDKQIHRYVQISTCVCACSHTVSHTSTLPKHCERMEKASV
jgi:hypothetical protein